jgi:hypothetical protein
LHRVEAMERSRAGEPSERPVDEDEVELIALLLRLRATLEKLVMHVCSVHGAQNQSALNLARMRADETRVALGRLIEELHIVLEV